MAGRERPGGMGARDVGAGPRGRGAGGGGAARRAASGAAAGSSRAASAPGGGGWRGAPPRPPGGGGLPPRRVGAGARGRLGALRAGGPAGLPGGGQAPPPAPPVGSAAAQPSLQGAQGGLGGRVLSWVEGGSRVGAVAGAAACLVTGQVAFAALPLALPLAGAAARWGRRRGGAGVPSSPARALPPPGEDTLERTLTTVRRLESKLGGLEGSVLAAGQTAAEAARLAAEAAEVGARSREAETQDRLQQEETAGSHLRAAASQREAETVQGLARLEARLGGVEGSLGGLEVAQGEALRRMSAAVDAAVSEAGDAISSEVRLGMEPLRRLPTLLASALPPGELVSLEASVPPGGVGPGDARLLPEPVALSERQLQELRASVANELSGAVERLGDPGLGVADERWEALGRRLGAIEESIAATDRTAQGMTPQGGARDFEGFAEEVKKVRAAAEAAAEAADRAATAASAYKPGTKAAPDKVASCPAEEGLTPEQGPLCADSGTESFESVASTPTEPTASSWQGGARAYDTASASVSGNAPAPLGVLWQRQDDGGSSPLPAKPSQSDGSYQDSTPGPGAPLPVSGPGATEDLSMLSARELGDRGLERLRRGRALAAEIGGAGAAEALFREAKELLEEAVESDPAYLPAKGNLGNALLAHAQLKLGLAAAVQASPTGPGVEERQASVQELRKESVNMLVLAGKCYRALLEEDARDGLAFMFWGRALELRGDLLVTSDENGAAGLYTSAIEKFNQALERDGENTEALLSWGNSLLKLSALEEPGRAEEYVKDARTCFENARSIRPGPETDAGLRACDEADLQRRR